MEVQKESPGKAPAGAFLLSRPELDALNSQLKLMNMYVSELRKAFTVVELLVVTVIVALLASLTVGALRGMQHHQELEHNAGSFARMLAYGQAQALAGGAPVFLAMTVPDATPETAAYRAYSLVRISGNPELLQDWQVLPRDVFFAPDPEPDPDRVDLLSAPVFDRIAPSAEFSSDLFPPHVKFSGEVALMLMILPDGGFYSLPDDDSLVATLQNAAVVMQRGAWYLDTTGSYVFAPDAPRDAIRIRLRPRTGNTHVERILP